MKQMKVKELSLIFDINFYLDKWSDDVYIEEYLFHDNWDDDGWYDIELFKFDIEKYANYIVDNLQLYGQGGFRLRITKPKTFGEKLGMFLLKLLRF